MKMVMKHTKRKMLKLLIWQKKNISYNFRDKNILIIRIYYYSNIIKLKFTDYCTKIIKSVAH